MTTDKNFIVLIFIIINNVINDSANFDIICNFEILVLNIDSTVLVFIYDYVILASNLDSKI